MKEKSAKTYADFVLPSNVVSKVDVARLVSEFERIDNELTSSTIRAKTGASEGPKPLMSEQAVDFLAQNSMEIGDGKSRAALLKQLHLLKNKLQVIHMTFATQADSESLQQLVQWLRQSVHPQAVISVGIQPSLVGGVYVRSTNKVYDLSLRARLKGAHGELVNQLEALNGKN